MVAKLGSVLLADDDNAAAYFDDNDRFVLYDITASTLYCREHIQLQRY
jgi:hypothetical protein